MEKIYSVWPDGRVFRLTQRQVGWLGQTGRLYSMEEDPSKTEPGSFSPVFMTVESDFMETPEEMLS